MQHQENIWVCFDDDKVTECSGEDLPRKLDGGTAHSHMSCEYTQHTGSI